MNFLAFDTLQAKPEVQTNEEINPKACLIELGQLPNLVLKVVAVMRNNLFLSSIITNLDVLLSILLMLEIIDLNSLLSTLFSTLIMNATI